MAQVRPKPSYPRGFHNKWYGCSMCGGQWTEDSEAQDSDGNTLSESVGWGMLYKESETVVGKDGIRRCVWHHRAKYYIKSLKDAKVDIDEDRGDEIKFT